MTEGMVTRIDRHGLGPVLQALIRSDPSDPIHQAARAHMVRRMVEPMVADLTQREVDGPRLQSEIVISALVGVSLGRALGWFDELKAVAPEHLVELVTGLLGEG
jgi:hypothetical protein